MGLLCYTSRTGPRFAPPRDGCAKVGPLSWPLLPPSYERRHGHAERIELATDRRIRERNKINYRLAHWPIWIFVFFIAPGPLTFDLFAHGFDRRMALWLLAVLVGTGIAGLLGSLPGVEPRPYIIRFTEDRPNPLYRRVCYTLAWSEVIAFAVLNITGLVMAIVTGTWQLRQLYDVAYFPIVGTVWLLGAFGLLPRVKPSTQGEGHERRYFYGSVWAVAIAQPIRRSAMEGAPSDRAPPTPSSSSSSWASLRSSAIRHGGDCSRELVRSFRVSSPCPTDGATACSRSG